MRAARNFLISVNDQVAECNLGYLIKSYNQTEGKLRVLGSHFHTALLAKKIMTDYNTLSRSFFAVGTPYTRRTRMKMVNCSILLQLLRIVLREIIKGLISLKYYRT